MTISNRPSPNFDDRNGHEIDMLVLHYTGMKSTEAALARLCDPETKVSSHYLIDENGAVISMVDEDKRAWHAGLSYWRGNSNINQRSIGIELANPGHEFGYRKFPQAQMESLVALAQDILSRYVIPARNIVGHSDIAPMRKSDPGELFDWKFLAAHGIGLFPSQPLDPGESDKMLTNIGYDMTSPSHAILAFQRRYRPDGLTGLWDRECGGILEALLKLL